MQIVGAFLAEYAEIVGRKLNVTGGVLDWIQVPRAGTVDAAGEPLVVPVVLVTLLQAGPDDYVKPSRMKLEMVGDGGDPVVVAAGEVVFDGPFAENRFWLTPIGLAAHKTGRMVLIESVEGGGQVSVPVELRVGT